MSITRDCDVLRKEDREAALVVQRRRIERRVGKEESQLD